MIVASDVFSDFKPGQGRNDFSTQDKIQDALSLSRNWAWERLLAHFRVSGRGKAFHGRKAHLGEAVPQMEKCPGFILSHCFQFRGRGNVVFRLMNKLGYHEWNYGKGKWNRLPFFKGQMGHAGK